MRTIRQITRLLRDAAHRFGDDDPLMLAGALAFFTVFAIPPILIIIIYGLGLFVGADAASTGVFNRVADFMGPAGAGILEDIVAHYFVESQNLLQKLLTAGIFLFASSSFFLIIQHAINRIWRVKPKPGNNLKSVFKNRALSFGVILLMGLILSCSFALHAAFNVLKPALHQLQYMQPVLNVAVALVLGALAFAIIFKFLPDVIIEWKVVWVGAGITSLLFQIGAGIIGVALRSSNVQAMYGTAGSTAIFLLWVFYCSLILFFGAKITQQYARSHAISIRPKPYAVQVQLTEVQKP